MNKLILILNLLISSYSFAHCPYEISYESEVYCADLEWENTEIKTKGDFNEEEGESPYLIPMREATPLWAYSKALIRVWKNGDKNHKPVFLEGLRFFPYMNMVSGHHHGGSHLLDVNDEGYVLSQMAFHQMPGCWSIRWSFNEVDEMKSSSVLLKVNSYENLSDNTEVAEFCMVEPGDGDHHSGHHDH